MDLKAFKAGIKQRKELTLVGPMVASIPKELHHLPQILVDGGTRIKKKHPLHFSVGDGDSFGQKLDLKVNPDKDYSDLSLALSLIPKNIHYIHLVGFLGGREDHELINLGEIHYFLSNCKQTEVHVWGKRKKIYWGLSKGVYRFSQTGTFSLFTFKNNKISLKGKCEYPLKSKNLKAHSSQGLSNVGFGLISLKCLSPLFVIFPAGKKLGAKK